MKTPRSTNTTPAPISRTSELNPGASRGKPSTPPQNLKPPAPPSPPPKK